MELFRRVCAPVARRHNEVFWTDRNLGAGDWEKQIDAIIAKTTAAVFLVSLDSLDSEFINEKELPRFLRASRERGMPVVWVLLEPCLWYMSDFSRL